MKDRQRHLQGCGREQAQGKENQDKARQQIPTAIHTSSDVCVSSKWQVVCLVVPVACRRSWPWNLIDPIGYHTRHHFILQVTLVVGGGEGEDATFKQHVVSPLYSNYLLYHAQGVSGSKHTPNSSQDHTIRIVTWTHNTTVTVTTVTSCT